jgi:ATP-dependent DNA helicase PIF1
MTSNILETIESSKNNFLILGKAGVGKSTLIKVLKKSLGRQCIVVCPTGIAAQNVKGQTINSFFKIPPRNEMKSWEIENSGEKLAELINTEMQELNTIIIDEISMVNQFVLEFISSILKKAKNNLLPFGGMRMILIGDLFQLPPIDKGNLFGDSIFFWHSSSYKNSNFKTLELNQVHRQINNVENANFIEALNRIRIYQIEQRDLNLINERLSFNVDSIKTTILTSKRDIAARYNEIGLNNTNGPTFEFDAVITGKWFESEYPKDTTIKLKVGVPVLFIKNDPSGEYKNGTRGVITEIDEPEKKLKVKISTDKIINVEFVSWAHPKYNRASQDETIIVKDTFKHFPIVLGFALTIHKSQGMTLDSIHLDLGTGAFAPGQLYVALSRIRNFSNLSIGRRITSNDIVSSSEIVSFYKNLNPQNAELVLSSSEINTINTQREEVIESNGNTISSPEMSRILFRKGCDIEDIQQERSRLGFREVLPGTIINHIISKHEEFSKEELDRIVPVSAELEQSVVSQLKKMTINEQTTLTEIRNNLEENEIDWNVLKLIGYRNNILKIINQPNTNRAENSEQNNLIQNITPVNEKCQNCNKQLQGDKTKLLCYDCYKKLPKSNQIAIRSSNAYKPWSEADDKRLLQLKLNGYTNALIAKELNRTKGAIDSRLKKLIEK